MEIKPAISEPETILSLDIGEKRIGVARAHLGTLFPVPLTTLDRPESFIADIIKLTNSERAACVVAGLPRGLGGQETAQTTTVRNFVSRLEQELPVPVYWSDEALTSEKAESELRKRGKPYAKGDIDALAATYILDDFIKEHPEQVHV